MELCRLPLTYFFEWGNLDERMRRSTMAEFAANGAKHLVLTDGLLKMLCGTPSLYRKLAAAPRLRCIHVLFGAFRAGVCWAVPLHRYRKRPGLDKLSHGVEHHPQPRRLETGPSVDQEWQRLFAAVVHFGYFRSGMDDVTDTLARLWRRRSRYGSPPALIQAWGVEAVNTGNVITGIFQTLGQISFDPRHHYRQRGFGSSMI